MKTCSLCNQYKPFSDFYKTQSGHTSRCKPCVKTSADESRKRNRDKVRARNHKTNYLHRYGITLEEKQTLREKANLSCQICFKILSFKMACVDHDHKTKKVRGILCSKCNFALGLFRDDQVRLEQAIKYLKETA